MPEPARHPRLRSRDILSLMSGRTLWRVARGMARAPLDEHYAGSPIAVCWFVNFACNARCAFCCKAAEIRAGHTQFPPLDAARAGELLRRIRASVDMLYLSGGEPLVHPELETILRSARALGFKSVGMSTNLITLDRQWHLLDHLDAIAASIHSPDVPAHAAQLGVPEAAARRVFDSLDRLAEDPRRGRLNVLINCVITATNLDTVPAMLEFTRQRGFLLELVPANEPHRAPAELAGNPRYEQLIDWILEQRRAGRAAHLAGSTSYYRRIRNFEPFRCFPYGVPNLMPDGRLCTPCDHSGQYSVNVLDYPDLKAAVKASLDDLGAYPCRQGYCFKAGILERSRLFGLLARRSHAN